MNALLTLTVARATYHGIASNTLEHMTTLENDDAAAAADTRRKLDAAGVSWKAYGDATVARWYATDAEIEAQNKAWARS
jgi:hypothetical protein